MMRRENEGCAESLPGTGAEWVVFFHSSEMTQEGQRALAEWRVASAGNDADFRRAERVWQLTGALAEHPAIRAELDQLRRKAQAREASTAWRVRSTRSWLAVAATLAVTIAAATLLVSSRNTDWHDAGRGDLKMVALPDGSSIAVNTDTRVGVRYSATDRDLTLNKGEALFEVAPDPTQRPFTVHARNGYVRALGTRFNVITEDDLVTVTLLRGRVEVVARGDAGEQRRLLEVNESIAYGRSGSFVSADPTTASPLRIEGWRAGTWSFDGLSIERAVREYNRYAAKPLLLDRDERWKTEISGQYERSDPDAFVAMIAEVTHSKVIDQGDSVLLVPMENEK